MASEFQGSDESNLQYLMRRREEMRERIEAAEKSEDPRIREIGLLTMKIAANFDRAIDRELLPDDEDAPDEDE